LQNGIIEPVPRQELAASKSLSLLPHHAVEKPSTTTSLRIVFDGSASTRGDLSLNECLHVGPNMVPNILDILVRFRLNTFLVLADIAKAYLQVAIHPRDRDWLRFLWVDEISHISPDKPLALVQYHFRRLPFGITPSAFVLAAVLDLHVSSSSLPADNKKAVLESLYVDNLSAGSDSVDSLFDFSIAVKNVFDQKNFPLRKWVSNSPAVSNRLRSNDFHSEEGNSFPMLG
jgi:hypothetical protein